MPNKELPSIADTTQSYTWLVIDCINPDMSNEQKTLSVQGIGIILPSYTDTYGLFDLLTSTPSATYIAAKLQWYIDLCVGSILYVGGWFAHFGWAFVLSENSQSNISRKKGLPVTAEKRNLLVGSLTLSLKIDLSRGERDVTMEVFVTFMWLDDVPFFKLSEKFSVSFKGEIYQNYSPVN